MTKAEVGVIKSDITLTHSVDEFPLEKMFGGDAIYAIPYFQREYRWGEKELKQLTGDIEQILNEIEDIHFIGAIILYSKPVPVGRSSYYEVVDGQQRIITIILFLAALAKMFCSLNKYDDASLLVNKFLLLGSKSKETSNIKFYASQHDRGQINTIFQDLMSDGKLTQELGNPTMRYLPHTGRTDGAITNQYRNMKKFLEKQKNEGGYDRLQRIYSILLRQLTSVQILLKNPTACPLIFERLNYRGQKVTTGDLVRNEIFSKLTDKPLIDIESMYFSLWEPFYKKFGDAPTFESYFFPYGLIKDPSVTKSDVFTILRSSWQNTDPGEIIAQLSAYQDSFLDIAKNENNCKLQREVRTALNNLYRAGLPSSTYPFLMQLIYHSSQNKIDYKETEKILKLIDSFLTRRAICGFEPTGLHSVLKALWRDCKSKPTFDNVKFHIKEHKTVPWPSDYDFKEAVKKRALYGSRIAPYFIAEYDRSLGKDVPSDEPEIEHVLPQALTDEWEKVFGKAAHRAYKDTLANLLPLSSLLNKSVQQKPYAEKKSIYAKDSMFATPREFAQKYQTWDRPTLLNRANELAKWAVKRWPY
jgi:hypothetical protein